MEMASARTKIRHFLGFTFHPRAGSPVILQLSGQKSVPPLMGDTAGHKPREPT